MINKGKLISEKYGFKNVEFHHSGIEKLPFKENEFDVEVEIDPSKKLDDEDLNQLI